MIKPILLIGPTAIGKTAFSLALATKLNAEIISADSMQIYREMSIGTAKPSTEELGGIPYHLINMISVREYFDVKQYLECATRAMEDIRARNKNVIITGGTGLYVRALLQGIIQTGQSDEAYRKKWEVLLEQNGKEFIWHALHKVDPVKAKALHVNNTRRVVRALSYYEANGHTISSVQDHWDRFDHSLSYVILGLSMPREIIYERIESRVDDMFEKGLPREVKSIMEMNVTDKTCWQAIGYKELLNYFEGKISLDQARDEIKRESRRFAKRQLTWFNKMNKLFKIYWIDMLGQEPLKNAMHIILEQERDVN